MHPEVYYQLKRNVSKKRTEREQYIEHVRNVLTKKLEAVGLEATVTGRPKHFYSIYQKMQSQHLMYDQIYDLVAFRLLVDSPRECYEALGIVHQNWKPVPGRFRDYIAMPKANMYQSLHTTVIGPFGERMGADPDQRDASRRRSRNRRALAVQGSDREGLAPGDRALRLAPPALRSNSTEDPQEFMRSVKEDLFDERSSPSPKGDPSTSRRAPPSSTLRTGCTRRSASTAPARVNGKLVPLKYQLQSGDTVEIVTTTRQTPSKDWLKIVTTTRAKERIRNWIKIQQRRRSLEIGNELLDRDLRRYRQELGKLRKSGDLDRAAHELGFKDEESLVAAVGYGRLPTQQVLARLIPDSTPDERKDKSEGTLQKLFRMVGRTGRGGVQVTSTT
jgi:GTP pyrophosphokinase